MPNGDDPQGSSRFPPRVCPQCRGHEIPCDLCGGDRVVSRFKAAAWLSSHPEVKDSPGEMPATQLPDPDDKGKG